MIFIYSVMGGGKTKALIDFYKKGDSIVLKPSFDTRDGLNIVRSRNGETAPAFLIDEEEDLYAFLSSLGSTNYILIDEVQFLSSSQVEAVRSFTLDREDVTVILFGLLTDYRANLFEGSKRAIELSDSIVPIVARDSEGNRLTHNMRKSGDSSSVLLVGGDEVYKAVTAKDFFREEKHDGNQN